MHYGCDGTYKYTLQPDWSREERELQVHYFAGTQPSHAFPFFIVKNASRYSNSSLSKLFNCDKDMFYRFMNDGNVKWRKLLYAMNLQLIKKISSSTTVHHDKPVCLIIDDTDAPRTGMTTELIGRIWSHVHQKSILGYKCLTMMLSNGVNQLFFDFSLHGEEGKDKQLVLGLTAKQRKNRYTENHEGLAVKEHVDEYLIKKTDKTIDMVKNVNKSSSTCKRRRHANTT